MQIEIENTNVKRIKAPKMSAQLSMYSTHFTEPKKMGPMVKTSAFNRDLEDIEKGKRR